MNNHGPFSFGEFKEFLAKKIDLTPPQKEALNKTKTLDELNRLSETFTLTSDQLAEYVADYTKLPFFPFIDPDNLKPGMLTPLFCQKNLVMCLKDQTGGITVVLFNPFDLQLADNLKAFFKDTPFSMGVTSWNVIHFLTGSEEEVSYHSIHYEQKIAASKERSVKVYEEEYATIRNVNNILYQALAHRASDIHLEPKEAFILLRFRIDGDMCDIYTLRKDSGVKIISRFKVLADMDIAERRKAQDGAVEASIGNRRYQLRLATSSTPYGESLVIRFLDPNIQPKRLDELGMTKEQAEILVEFARSKNGLVLVVGPTGSGKTTTIYGLLHQAGSQNRSLISVEDPVEYKIPFANQQQVNEKAGITFESLLKSLVRQDPDILFLGEVRDAYSAKASLDFSSTGHLTITTLHTSNAVTAIFRLERLGVSRGGIADTILGVVAQRLLKKLCPHCRRVAPLSKEEKDILRPFCRPLPLQTAHPVGCIKCDHLGYLGREGIYEILRFDTEIANRIRSGEPISEIRRFCRDRGDFLMSHHALEKVNSLIFSLKDVYEKILIEELVVFAEDPAAVSEPAGASILVVDDDVDHRILIERFLKTAGYEVTAAADGIEALLEMGARHFDLIISDVNMPNLDGFRLIEMKSQKGIETPVLFLTSRSEMEDELRGFELGAVNYLKKPVDKQTLLLQIKKMFAGKIGGRMPKKILVVDDEKDVVSVLLRRMKAQGYEALSAGDGEEALRIIKKVHFDLIILDIMMPVMDGTELAQILRNDPITKNIPLIFLTVLGAKQKDAGYILAGTDIVFAKPFDIKELLGKIEEVLS